MDTLTVSPVHMLALAALAHLGDVRQVHATIALASGTNAEIACRGPHVPETLPPDIADYETVLAQPPSWTGAYRLRVKVPLVVLDLAWNDGEPVRIMTFCRGDWEADLLDALS